MTDRPLSIDEIEMVKANIRAEPPEKQITRSWWLGRLLGKRTPSMKRADLLAWGGSVTTRSVR